MFQVPGCLFVQFEGKGRQRLTRGHPAALDAIAQHVDRRAEGELVVAHPGTPCSTIRRTGRLAAPLASDIVPL
jgi:hypothetical protein